MQSQSPDVSAPLQDIELNNNDSTRQEEYIYPPTTDAQPLQATNMYRNAIERHQNCCGIDLEICCGGCLFCGWCFMVFLVIGISIFMIVIFSK